jgi:hypothetical protein
MAGLHPDGCPVPDGRQPDPSDLHPLDPVVEGALRSDGTVQHAAADLQGMLEQHQRSLAQPRLEQVLQGPLAGFPCCGPTGLL